MGATTSPRSANAYRIGRDVRGWGRRSGIPSLRLGEEVWPDRMARMYVRPEYDGATACYFVPTMV